MTKTYLTIPVVVAGALSMGGIATAAEPTTAELMAQIQQLQAKVQQMENRQLAASKADVDATVASVLRDAEKRSQLLDLEGFTAGWHDGHFVIQSADGNYKLMPMFQFQFRNTTNFAESAKNGGDDLVNGFEVRRMKMEFQGNAVSKDLTYNFRWATESDGGGIHLENAYIMYKFSDDWAFKVGQFKDNWTHEETVSSKRQLAAERSQLNELLGGGQTDYVQGVSLVWDNGRSLRAEFGYHDGYNSDNTTWQDVGGTAVIGVTPTNFGFSGRFEWSIGRDTADSFKQYDDFTAMGNKEGILVLGAGLDWSQGSSNNVVFHTVDVQWETSGGLDVYAAYVGAYRDFNDATDDTFYDWGFLVQAGYMFGEHWELFARYDFTSVDSDALPTGSEDTFMEFTVGANYYMQGHNAKVTLDLGYLNNGSPVGLTGLGIRGTDDAQVYFRGQFQLLL